MSLKELLKTKYMQLKWCQKSSFDNQTLVKYHICSHLLSPNHYNNTCHYFLLMTIVIYLLNLYTSYSLCMISSLVKTL